MAGRTGPNRQGQSVAQCAQARAESQQLAVAREKDDFEALAADLVAEYQPSTATQRILLERIAMCVSKLRRLHTIEGALFHKARVDDVQNKTDRFMNPSAMRLCYVPHRNCLGTDAPSY